MSKQTSTAHPPIPPGCEHFKLHPGWGYVFHMDHPMVDSDTPGWCVDLPGYPREKFEPEMLQIVAAVAEVAWLREAERLRNIAWGATAGYHSMDRGMAIAEATAPAEANARAWRAWGAQ